MIYIIYGPTGSGKTDLAISMILKNRKERNIDGEIISADSRQIYIGMDIGTNKDKKKYIDNDIKYHLIDIITPDKRFSVWLWNQMAKKIIEDITSGGKDIYIVGGTGLYIDSLLYPRKYKINALDYNNKEINNLEKLSISQLKEKFTEEFHDKYENLNNSEKNNKRRLISNYFKLINIKNKDKQLKNYEESNNYILEKGTYIFITPSVEREELYKRINERVEKMFKDGFLDEVKILIEKGFQDCESINGTGYKEVMEYHKMEDKSESELNKVKEAIKQSNRNYAKRQLTWFKKYETLK